MINLSEPYDPVIDGLRQLGYNSNISTTLEDVTETGMTIIPEPAAALAMQLASDSASDTGVVSVDRSATGGSANTLIDSGATFVTDLVAPGDFVINDTKHSYSKVLTVDSETEITLELDLSLANIFENGDNYRIVDLSAGGTGAQVSEIHGVDDDWAVVEEFVVLNGATPVACVHNYLRINNLHHMFVGSDTFGAGDVDLVQTATPANIMDRVSAGGNKSLQAYYAVPLGQMVRLTDWSAGSDGTKAVRFILTGTADYGNRANTLGVYHFQDIIVSDGASGDLPFTLDMEFPEKTTIKVSANAVGGNGAGSVSFGFSIKEMR